MNSVLCGQCQQVYFDPQPTDEQLQRYYEGGYENYFFVEERLAFEPSWADFRAAVADEASAHWQTRWTVYDTTFPDRLEYTGRIVDFGGNDGALTRRIFPKAVRIDVVDIAFDGDLVPVLQQCDLLFAAHVLEHLPRPFEIFSRLIRELRVGTMVFAEVPQQYTGRLKDEWEKQRAIGPGGSPLTIMHEHIQHFSEKSLGVLLGRCSVEVTKATIIPGSIIAMNGVVRHVA